MTTLFLRKAVSAVVALALFVTLAPQTTFAASLEAPDNLDINGYFSDNDPTPTFTWDSSEGATWYEVALDTGGFASIGNDNEYTFSSSIPDGWHTFYVRAYNSSSSSSASSFSFEIDTVGPTVPVVSPSSATEDEGVTFYVYPYGEAAPTSCMLYVDGESVGTMSKNGSAFSESYTFSWDGTYTVYARCTDGDGNVTTGESRTVTVNNEDDEDDEFVVPAVSPSSATEDEEVTFEVTPYGDLDAETCKLYVDGSNKGTMSEDDGEFTFDYTFSNNGTYSVYAYCEDENGDWTWGTSRNVYVYEHDEDDEFVVPAVSPSSATEDEEVTFEVTPYGDLDAETCKLYVDGSNKGTMSEDDGEFSFDYTFSNDGDYTVYAYCEDENGDWTKGTSRTVEVDNESDSNNGELSVPKVTPSSADEDEETEFTVRPESRYNITDCWLYVDDVRVETMDEESTDVFVAEYTFKNEGSYDVHAYCKDSSGDTDTGEERTVTVGDDNDDEAERGSLIKTDCGTSTDVADPCRAVYYYDEHGDRHAFPNESTYFTWFADFDDVVEVSDDFMASIDLGDNVTYRPGSVLVKFETSPKVYAVEAERTLRHYESLSVLESDYGDDWEEVLVSLPDTLYKNYKIGNEIDSKGDFDRTDAYYSVDSIEDIF